MVTREEITKSVTADENKIKQTTSDFGRMSFVVKRKPRHRSKNEARLAFWRKRALFFDQIFDECCDGIKLSVIQFFHIVNNGIKF